MQKSCRTMLVASPRQPGQYNQYTSPYSILYILKNVNLYMEYIILYVKYVILYATHQLFTSFHPVLTFFEKYAFESGLVFLGDVPLFSNLSFFLYFGNHVRIDPGGWPRAHVACDLRCVLRVCRSCRICFVIVSVITYIYIYIYAYTYILILSIYIYIKFIPIVYYLLCIIYCILPIDAYWLPVDCP